MLKVKIVHKRKLEEVYQVNCDGFTLQKEAVIDS